MFVTGAESKPPNQRVNRLVFRRELFDVRLPPSDPLPAEMLENYARRLLKRLPAEDDIKNEVREVLLNTLGGGAAISLKATARHLAMSDRSLQRKLSGQGTFYREQPDELRYEQPTMKTDNDGFGLGLRNHL